MGDAPDVADGLPPGNHPLEIAARSGIGPLSPLGQDQWHGRTRPCVSCGQLVLRDTAECVHCGQDLSAEMLEKMLAHSGPWYVLEHVRPFPGVSLERIIRQVRKGLITETSIIRGPATDHQWRFAVETPGLCRYFSRCWQCHETVSPSDTTCRNCLSYLSFERPRSVRAASAMPTPQAPEPPSRTAVSDGRPGGTEHLRQLSAALHRSDLPAHEPVWDEPPRLAGIRATWIAAGLLVVVVLALMWVTRGRDSERSTPLINTPGIVHPLDNR